jgi:NAD(P)-dependent dehydrogenase (short-subunit alcohol dehydrogenase family)
MTEQSVAVVTGANSGLGLITAQELARRGRRVVMAVRNTTAGAERAEEIRRAVPSAELEVRELDLADLASVREFAAKLTEPLDLLVNNAGLVVLGRRRTTADGFELHLGTNMLGHFALTGLVLDRFTTGRIVNLSSIVHKGAHLDLDDLQFERGFDGSRAYGRSKLATTVFGLELDRRLRAAGSPVISVLAHPGLSRSNLTARAWGNGRLGRLIAALGSAITQSAERGAQPQLYAATAPNVRGGQFFGPSGFRETRGDVTEVRPSAEAADPAVGRALWAASEELTGVRYLGKPR